MMNQNDFEILFKELNIKTPLTEVPSKDYQAIHSFLENELAFRRQHKIRRLLRCSGIKQVKTFEQFDWSFNPKIPKEELFDYKNSLWVEKAFNLVLIGDAGLGKSHIARALCYEAILQGHTAMLQQTQGLLLTN